MGILSSKKILNWAQFLDIGTTRAAYDTLYTFPRVCICCETNITQQSCFFSKCVITFVCAFVTDVAGKRSGQSRTVHDNHGHSQGHVPTVPPSQADTEDPSGQVRGKRRVHEQRSAEGDQRTSRHRRDLRATTVRRGKSHRGWCSQYYKRHINTTALNYDRVKPFPSWLETLQFCIYSKIRILNSRCDQSL